MNAAMHVSRAARLFPDHPAILFEGRTIDYATLDRQADQVSAGLRAAGVGPGDRVALFLPNIPEFASCYMGILRVGALAVSVNAALKTEEVSYILGDSGAVTVFTTEELASRVDRQRLEHVRLVILCEGGGPDPTLEDWIASAGSHSPVADCDPADPAVILYTSGTTGSPKGAVLTHGNLVFNMYATSHHLCYRHEDRLALFVPLFHVFGQNHLMNSGFASAATLVLHRRFVPDLVLDSIQRDRVTMLAGVPTTYIQLLAEPLDRYDLSSVRHEFSAAATMPREVAEHWQQRFGRPIFEGYGLTECSPLACYNHDFKYRLGSVGSPVENVEVRIVGPDGATLRPGESGEIVIRGPGVLQGYWRNPTDTALTLRDGWLHSGDLGTFDDDGYLYIVDRLKDMINVSGFKVWPAEVEQVLYRMPAVKEAAVIGLPDPVRGETVHAVIVANRGASVEADDVIAFCREQIAAYKAPTSVEFVEALPKSATGKVLRRVLREAAV